MRTLLLVVALSLPSFGQILGPIMQGPPSGSAVTFSQVGTAGSCQTTAALTCTPVLGQTPTAGNLIACVVSDPSGGTGGRTATVKDSGNNSFTQAVVENDTNNNSFTFIQYLVVVGSITSSITVTVSGGNGVSAVCGEFSRSSGTWTADQTAVGMNVFTGTGTVSTASATPTGTNNLLIGGGTVVTAKTGPSWTAVGSWVNFGTSSLADNAYPFTVLGYQLNQPSAGYTFDETFAPMAGGITWTAAYVSFK